MKKSRDYGSTLLLQRRFACSWGPSPKKAPCSGETREEVTVVLKVVTDVASVSSYLTGKYVAHESQRTFFSTHIFQDRRSRSDRLWSRRLMRAGSVCDSMRMNLPFSN